jgi:hypothetical protein
LNDVFSKCTVPARIILTKPELSYSGYPEAMLGQSMSFYLLQNHLIFGGLGFLRSVCGPASTASEKKNYNFVSLNGRPSSVKGLT